MIILARGINRDRQEKLHVTTRALGVGSLQLGAGIYEQGSAGPGQLVLQVLTLLRAYTWSACGTWL
jgi:hypothetical protein